MDTAFVIVSLVIFGLIFGSFAGATVWRIRAWQLVRDKREKQVYDKAEYRHLLPLTKHTVKNDRSQCLHCSHVLHFVDLIPLISWISTGGRCRYCHVKIGWFEPLMEAGMAASLVLVYIFWPYDTSHLLGGAHLALWLLALIPLIILFAYDLKWFLLPSEVTYITVGLGLAVSILTVINSSDRLGAVFSIIGGCVILSGIYLLLNKVSAGRWVGFGDVELGLALALLLADWKLSFIALFAANFIGCLVVLPGIVRGKVGRSTEVQFGPLLIVGTIVALLAGHGIVAWYSNLL